MQGRALGVCALLRGALLIIPSVCDVTLSVPDALCPRAAELLHTLLPLPVVWHRSALPWSSCPSLGALWVLAGQAGTTSHGLGVLLPPLSTAGAGDLGDSLCFGKKSMSKAGLDLSPCAAGAVPPPRCEGFQEHSEPF